MEAKRDTSVDRLTATSAATTAAFAELQQDCREIASQGGELGAIATDLLRISIDLWALCEAAQKQPSRDAG